jgi:hypothetical protein
LVQPGTPDGSRNIPISFTDRNPKSHHVAKSLQNRLFSHASNQEYAESARTASGHRERLKVGRPGATDILTTLEAILDEDPAQPATT